MTYQCTVQPQKESCIYLAKTGGPFFPKSAVLLFFHEGTKPFMCNVWDYENAKSLIWLVYSAMFVIKGLFNPNN